MFKSGRISNLCASCHFLTKFFRIESVNDFLLKLKKYAKNGKIDVFGAQNSDNLSGKMKKFRNKFMNRKTANWGLRVVGCQIYAPRVNFQQNSSIFNWLAIFC